MSDMLSQRRTLIEALYLKTASGEIDWRDGLTQGSYSANIANQVIEIEKSSDEDNITIIITIFDGDYKVLESFSDASFSGFSPVRISSTSYYAAMNELYDMARRHSTGATKAVQNILDALKTELISDDEAIPF